jgi:hypothetical protein
MLFMVIERFRGGDPMPVRDRFLARGRLLPDGVVYHASWIDEANGRCFQLMEAADEGALQPWIAGWSDLIDFDLIPIVEPAEYWARLDDSTAAP